MSDKYFTVNIRAYLDKDDDAEDASLVGYFSLTVKPISVQASNISKTMAKKLSRVSILDEETCLLYTSPSPRDSGTSRMPSSA